MQTAWRSIRRAWPTSIGAAAILWAGLFAAPASAVPPTITSVTVTSYSTDNDHSIALPQTRIPELTVHGTNLFPAVGAGPLVVLRRAGYPDKYFPIALNVRGGDNTNGWVTIRDVDLSSYAPGSFDIVIDQAQPLGGEDVAVKANAFELRAQGPEQLVRRSAWGGPINKTQPVGNKIYLGSGCRFVVLDATNEMNPVELGSIDLQSTVLDFQIAGNYAYVCTNSLNSTGGPSGFCVVDVSTPAGPRMIWSSRSLRGITDGLGSTISALDATRVWLKGSYAYVTSSSGLFLFNLANPAAPAYVRPVLTYPRGRPTHDGIRPETIKIVGNYLYTFALDGGGSGGNPSVLRVYDLGPGDNVPVLVSLTPLTPGGGSVSDEPVAVAADETRYAFVTESLWDGFVPHLWLWDLTNRSAPMLMFKLPLTRAIRNIALGDGVIMAAEQEGNEFVEYPDQSRGLLVYDIATSPTSPALISNLKTHGSVYGVGIFGSRAYIADHGEGMIILNCSQPSNPQRMGGFFSPSSIRDVARNGDLVYVSDQWNGFTVLNVADPARPAVVGKYQIDHVARPDLQGNWGIAYQNGRVYLAVGDGATFGDAGHLQSGIDVVDVTNPALPALLQAFDPTDCIAARGLEVDGSTLRAGMVVPIGGCGPGFTAELWSIGIQANGTLAAVQSRIGLSAVANTPVTQSGFTFTEGGIVDQRGAGPFVTSFDSSKYGFAIGNEAFYASGGWSYGLRTRTIADPSNPGSFGPYLHEIPNFLVTSLAHTGGNRLLTTSTLYSLVDPGMYMHLFDTTNPLAPRLLSTLTNPFGLMHPQDNNQDLDNGPAAMLKLDGSLVFAAERVGHMGYAPNGALLSHGLVIVEHVVPTPGCPADFNQQGEVTIQDLLDYLVAWFGQDTRADFNEAGGVTLQDLFDFLARWFAGC